jgi:hypothetical protein
MKRTRPPKHRVDIALQAQDIAKVGAAISLTIRTAEGLVGTVQIGQGSFRWKAANKQRFKRIPWSDFARRMES